MKKYKFIISGGGTGGHIFPALSIADGLRKRYPESEILFVGAEGKMEMEKVPAHGYRIVGLPVAGFHRGEIIRNFGFLPKLLKSLWKARSVVRNFNPDCVVGVGGYASGPVLRIATQLGIPTLLQEQNSYAGITNKILGKKASKICVAYDRMERFFPKDKIISTGNPVRSGLDNLAAKPDEAYTFFNIEKGRPVVLVVGGSLGARTLNQSMVAGFEAISQSGVQFIWQCGKYYYNDMKVALEVRPVANIHLMEFISRMDLAYAVADVVISRAGAGTISELCLVGKPSVLVPSPNVAEDHQTSNAMALVDKGAALLVKDIEAKEKLIAETIGLVNDKAACEKLSDNIKKLATPKATEHIVEVISTLIEKR